jgi:hypothetical protein
MHKYVKIGKEMEKGTKKRVSSASWAGGGGEFGPAGARAAAWAGGPLGPPAGETARGRRRGRGPTCH